MKIAEIRKMSTAELATTLTQLSEELAELRRRTTLGEINNVQGHKTKA